MSVAGFEFKFLRCRVAATATNAATVTAVAAAVAATAAVIAAAVSFDHVGALRKRHGK